MNARKSDDPRRWFAEEVARLDADTDLSTSGRDRRKLEAYDKMTDDLKRINREVADEHATAKRKAAAAIDSPPGGWTAEARSLLERQEAELKSPDQARDAMEAAADAGDALMLWAVGRTIVGRVAGASMPTARERWRVARNELPEHDPSWAPKLEAWDAANGVGRKAARDAEDRLISSMKPPPPREGDPATNAPAPSESDAPVSREAAFISRVFGDRSH